MAQNALTPYVYSRLTDYLNAVRENYGLRKKKVSLQMWAERLGYKSSRSLELIVSGERLPSQKMLGQIADDLKLNAKEQQYFFMLAQRERLIRDKKPVQDIDKKMAEARPHHLEVQYINNELFRRISEWYPLVLRELKMAPDFRNDIQWIQKRLKNKITSSQIAFALAEWEGLTLGETIYTQDDIPSEAVRIFHKKMLHRAIEVVDEVPVSEREYISLTFRSSTKSIENMKSVLREIRDRLVTEFDQADGSEVFQLNIVLYPHTELKKP